ncbi:MAG: 3-hydroxyacyl-CoA dehydrogenase [SAR202 cluster bacterium]|nr:3-hydroxyacyl-CoA dehydrogenase [SAR202 cluster bacterium]
MTLVRYEVSDDVAVITVDNPPVNALSPGVPGGIIDGLRQANSDSSISAVVLIGEGRGFIAGADIRYFSKPWPEGEPRLGGVIEGIETSSKPVVAAIHGHALGGGLELAMCCHYRVIVPQARVGQPEVKLGIPPGAGGTQRLPRLAGVKAALDMIVSGDPVTAQQSVSLGICDQLVEKDLLEGALEFASKVGQAGGPHQLARDRKVVMEDSELFEAKRKQIERRARGMRTPYACIECVEAAVELPFDEGLAREREIFEVCVASDESKAMRHVFFAERAAGKIPGVKKSIEPSQFGSAGVVGAGTMGGGITMNFANAGVPVTVVEQDAALLEKGLSIIQKNYATTVAKGRLSQEKMDARLALIKGSTMLDDLADADIVIEAIYEEMPAKKELFGRLDECLKATAVLTSNTSYLDVNEIAESIPKRIGNVLGTHFFSPANVMRLLEVVRTDTVDETVLMSVLNLGRKMGKLPIVSGVCHGFIGNRMLEGYFGEAAIMVEEGAEPEHIDRVMYEFGMAMGPLAVSDLAGLDIGWAKRKAAGNGVASDVPGSFVPNRLCEMGRYGQKTNRGYYLYEKGSRVPVPDPEVKDLAEQAARKFGIGPRDFDDREILERCMYPLINIGATILEEGIALRASDIDLVYLNGYGFPVWRGGPMHWAGVIGLDVVAEGVRQYSKKSDLCHWKLSRVLEKLADSGKSFEDYDRETQ